MIYKKCVMTIDKNKATLDEDIYLYRLDKNIELYFTIVNNKYRFNKGDMNNIILITNASFFQVRLYKNAEIKYTFAIQPTDGGQAILTITDDLIDDPIETGDYDFQISLLDEEKTSMISMPIVSKQLHVCEPLVSDDATMGKAVLGLSKLATGEIKNAFDSDGNYIREIHKDGDILSASIINKFEEALDTNTKAIKSGTGTSYDDTEIKTDINTIKTDLGSEELTTTAKDIKGAVNEVNAQFKDITQLIGSGNILNFDSLTVSTTVKSNVDESIIGQDYLGGYIEVQPDSWDGTNPPSTDNSTNIWGFPMSLLPTERNKIKNEIMSGNGKGIMFIRFPLGFAYRGYRNIDETSGLAKNIGERFTGQNATLKEWFSEISKVGGGLAPEYWCPAPYWLTSGEYSGSNNQLTAGGFYGRTTTLSSIKTSDSTQYNAQIQAFTDAILNDLEYLHQNIAPVRIFGLANEPSQWNQPYGTCKYDSQTYNDVLEVLYPKIQSSDILGIANGEKNEIKLLVDSDISKLSVASTFIKNHADWIWGYAYHEITAVSNNADWYKQSAFANLKKGKTNLIMNEYEYFGNNGTDEERCGNNMLHIINEAIYGEAKMLHPVIHICKPIGQNDADTNTRGYCLYATNLLGQYGKDITDVGNEYRLNKGTYIPNTNMYNAWKMFNDNLPIGAYRIGDYSNKIDNAGWVTYKYGGKLYIFMANRSANNVKISLTFKNEKNFSGKAYNMKYCGDRIKSKKGKIIDFIIPSYSGQVWIEDTINSYTIESIPCTSISLNKSNLAFTSKTVQTLTATVTPTNTTNKITWSVSPTGICTVNNGTVNPISNGNCVITAMCGSKSATCNVSVNIQETSQLLTNIEQGYINDSGELIPQEYEYVDKNYKTALITTIYINTTIGVRNIRIAEYDENKTFIHRQYGQDKGTFTMMQCKFELNSKTKYIRVGFISNEDITTVNNLFSTYTVSSLNDNLTYEMGKGISSVDGSDEVNSLKASTDYIQVNEYAGNTLTIVSDTTNNISHVVRFYDENKKYIGYSTQILDYNVTHTLPAKCYYIRLVLMNKNNKDITTELPNHTIQVGTNKVYKLISNP